MKRLARILAGIALALALLILGFVAATWAPDREVAELRGRWAPAPSAFVRVAGMDVHLRDEGPRDDPNPIVLLHGRASSLHTWEGWAQELKPHRRVIRFDLPGNGLTGPSPDGDYRIDTYIRFVTAVLDELGVRSCVLVGNSLGGRIAWGTAVATPSRIDKLILVDAAGYPQQSASVPIGFRVAQIPGLNRLLEGTLPRSLIEASVRNVYGDPGKVTPELVDRVYELTLRAGNRRAAAQGFAQAASEPGADRIGQIALPTLILWGGRDRLFLPSDAQRFQRDIAGSQLVVFDDLGHVPHEEDPARTVAAAKRFLG